MRIIAVLAISLVLMSPTSSQEFEVFTGENPMGAIPKPRPVNYLAKCLAGARLACEIFKSQEKQGGLEAGDIERSEYVTCNNKGGICLELATLDLDEGVSGTLKQRLSSIDINILFDYEKADVKSSETAKLTQIAAALKAPVNAGAKFAVIGHTDAKGSNAYNCRLSTQRAYAVSSLLLRLGITSDRLVTIGAGEYVLYDKQNVEAAKNRRVGFARVDERKGEVLGRLAKLCDSE